MSRLLEHFEPGLGEKRKHVYFIAFQDPTDLASEPSTSSRKAGSNVKQGAFYDPEHRFVTATYKSWTEDRCNTLQHTRIRNFLKLQSIVLVAVGSPIWHCTLQGWRFPICSGGGRRKRMTKRQFLATQVPASCKQWKWFQVELLAALMARGSHSWARDFDTETMCQT